MSLCLCDFAQQTHLEVDGRCASTFKTFIYEANCGLRARGTNIQLISKQGHEVSHPRKPEKTQLCARLRDPICKQAANVKPLCGLEVDVARILGICAFSGKTAPSLSRASMYMELGPEPGLRRPLVRGNSTVGVCPGVLFGSWVQADILMASFQRQFVSAEKQPPSAGPWLVSVFGPGLRWCLAAKGPCMCVCAGWGKCLEQAEHAFAHLTRRQCR